MISRLHRTLQGSDNVYCIRRSYATPLFLHDVATRSRALPAINIASRFSSSSIFLRLALQKTDRVNSVTNPVS
ncbi:uncharacterized protein CLUP02_10704 [Colletotrichum lupini]|uniref:Uncharacterized protein n=1 Tax=Colletotrichum lupini TaxID=145971 RepID=A0A9Q8WJL4_9PEZI|nr:uncharacterized protein CLUP02_10704 [Colletotrichum lupini]UQC85207.1 hypothetical protein CLUP02_10704 [Colletotrichum lupini]